MHGSNNRTATTVNALMVPDRMVRDQTVRDPITGPASNRIGMMDRGTGGPIAPASKTVPVFKGRVRAATAPIATGTGHRTTGANNLRVPLSHGPLRPGWKKHPFGLNPLLICPSMSPSKPSAPVASSYVV
ncbi:hypothetical protein GCM10028803_36130 [Larkinella knui]